MLRTILAVNRGPRPPSEFEAVVRRLADLYRDRLIVAEVSDAEELAGVSSPNPHLETPVISPETQNPQTNAVSMMLVGSFVPAVCDKGHEADVVVVWYGSLSETDGQTSVEVLSSLVRRAPRPVWLIREPQLTTGCTACTMKPKMLLPT